MNADKKRFGIFVLIVASLFLVGFTIDLDGEMSNVQVAQKQRISKPLPLTPIDPKHTSYLGDFSLVKKQWRAFQSIKVSAAIVEQRTKQKEFLIVTNYLQLRKRSQQDVLVNLVEVFGWNLTDVLLCTSPGIREELAGVRIIVFSRVEYSTLETCLPVLKSLGIQTWLWTDDLHWTTPIQKKARLAASAAADLILSDQPWHVVNFHFNGTLRKPIFFLPRCAGNNFLVDLNPHPIRKTLQAGAVNWSFYPWRCFVRATMDCKSSVSCLHGYGNAREGFEGNDFIFIIWAHFAGVTSGSRLRYVVSKFFEIPAAGSLLLAPQDMLPYLKILGFSPGTNMLSFNESNLASSIASIHRNPTKYQKIRKEGYNFIRDRHTCGQRAHKLNQIGDFVRNGGKLTDLNQFDEFGSGNWVDLIETAKETLPFQRLLDELVAKKCPQNSPNCGLSVLSQTFSLPSFNSSIMSALMKRRKLKFDFSCPHFC